MWTKLVNVWPLISFSSASQISSVTSRQLTRTKRAGILDTESTAKISDRVEHYADTNSLSATNEKETMDLILFSCWGALPTGGVDR